MQFFKKIKHFRKKLLAKYPIFVKFTHPDQRIADKNKTASQEIVLES